MAYVALALLKESLGITEDSRDGLLEQAIAAADALIERTTGRRFTLAPEATPRTYPVRGRVVVESDCEVLLVDDIADVTGMTIELGGYDGTSWTTLTDSYTTEPANAADRGWPVTRLRLYPGRWISYQQVRITAVWGWPAVPEDIETAALLQAARLFRRKDSPEGVAGSADWGLVRLPNLDPDVRALIAPYGLPGFG